MKYQIRSGVFETNSSSEHSITIMESNIYNDWKEGRIAIRFIDSEEPDDQDTWGNFWSKQNNFVYCNIGDMDANNRAIIDTQIIPDLEKEIETNINMPFEDREFYEKTYGKDFIENRNRCIYNNIDEWKSEELDVISKFYNGLYVTYNEYYQALRKGGCDSPFLHFYKDLVIFGTYFHS